MIEDEVLFFFFFDEAAHQMTFHGKWQGNGGKEDE